MEGGGGASAGEHPRSSVERQLQAKHSELGGDRCFGSLRFRGLGFRV